MIRRWTVIALAAICITALVPSAVAHPRATQRFASSGLPVLGALSHGGRWLVDGQGRVVMPHGVMDYTPTTADVPFLAAHGFGIVRAAIHMSDVEPQPGVFRDSVLATMKASVDALGAQGIYTLLDAHEDGYGPPLGPDGMPAWMQNTHGIPGTAPVFPVDNFVDPATNTAWQNLWHDAALPNGVTFTSETGVQISHLQEAYADFWRHVATYFKGDPALYGYDLLNEPWPGADYPYPMCATVGCAAFEQQYLAPFNHKVIAAVHSVDPVTLTSYEPNVQSSSGGTPTYLGKNSVNADGNSGINFHPYCLSGVWGAPGLSAGAVAPDPAEDAVCNRNIDNAFAGIYAHQQQACDQPAPGRYCSPAIISEFGSSEYNAETEHVLARADQYLIPWIFFQKSLAETTSPTARPQIINLIDRPYAYAVTGTPTAMWFDDGYRHADGSLCPSFQLAGSPVCPASHEFRFTYSTTSHTSKHASGPTLIYIPKLQYPNGYSVSVKGGHVVSTPGATWLQVINNGSASSVTVDVHPARIRAGGH